VGKVSVVTDSCSSIPDGMYAQYDLIMVPYYVHIQGKSYRDLVDMQREEFLSYLLETTKPEDLPKSANPSPGDYLEAFQRAARRGQDIISVHMTSLGSGAYQSALVAKEMLLKDNPTLHVEVIDTRNVSMCHGWMTLEAGRLAQEGKSLEEIVRRVRSMIPVTKMLQTADTLRYLYLGGRIGRAKHLVASILRIKPLIGMEDGVIVPLGTARSRRAAYRRIVEMVEQDVGEGGRIRVAIIHFGAPKDASLLSEMVANRFTCVELLMTQLSLALAIHTGPGTVGLCYFPVGENN